MSSGFLVASAPSVPLHYSGTHLVTLEKTKRRLADGDETLAPALAQLTRQADAALKEKPPSVTEKTRPGPKGDPHDYVSTAPYWWPNPSSADGLPYVRRDGEVNPESRTAASDQRRIEQLGSLVSTLALAYYFTGNEAYAAHAARCLRVWFLDAPTRMNPHMEYAQSVPGQNQGRPAGLIEAGGAVDAAEASVLLAGSSAWSTTDEEALLHWCSQFLDWLLTSKLGKAEGAATNNHGTLYDVRVSMLALKTGRTEFARKILLDAGRKRIAAQIESDGSQPHELSRTKSLSYSRLNLDGLTSLARLGGLVGVDLWRFTTTDGRSLKRAIDFLYPFAADPSLKWPHRQIAKFDRIELAGILRRAALAYDEPRYETLLSEIPGIAQLRLQLTIPRHAR